LNKVLTDIARIIGNIRKLWLYRADLCAIYSYKEEPQKT
jgi:hypothetical protein